MIRTHFRFPSILIVAACVSIPAFAQEKLPAGAVVTRLEANPASITLKTPYEYRQVLITATLKDGEQLDVTRMAPLAGPANLVKIAANGLVRPAGDGTGELSF